jgi:hypothetical protein
MFNLFSGSVPLTAACDSPVYYEGDFEEDEYESIDMAESFLSYDIGRRQFTFGDTPSEPLNPEQIVEGRHSIQQLLEKERGDTALVDATAFVSEIAAGIPPGLASERD